MLRFLRRMMDRQVMMRETCRDLFAYKHMNILCDEKEYVAQERKRCARVYPMKLYADSICSAKARSDGAHHTSGETRRRHIESRL